ncbi:MAG TPA: DUF885 domain-containing protein [Ideonella sp.]|nr:DUF885 domain-containing protein [Ideonella sp.]
MIARRQMMALGLAVAPSLPLGWAQAAPPAKAKATNAPTSTLHALFDEYWETSARMSPERATLRGDHRYGDRFTDQSPAAIAERDATVRRWLARARAIRREALPPADRVSLDIFSYLMQQEVDLQRFEGFRTMSLRPVFGFQQGFAGLLRNTPVDRPEQTEQVLARMAAYPRRVEQEIARLRLGVAGHWVPAKPVVQRVLEQIDGQIAPAPDQGPFFDPFTRLPVDWPAAQRESLQARARQAIADHVLPALRSLRAFVGGEYLAAAPEEGGLSRYPEGARLYELAAQRQTTTRKTPREIHAIGLAQLATLQAQMEGVMRETGFNGTLKEFNTFLHTDPKFFNPSPEAMLAAYREIAKRIDPELPRLFAELPRATYGIRAMPAFAGPGAADNYSAPALDGTRPGWYNANLMAYQRRPKWAMETLLAHETVPGHHLQNARAREMQGLPAFRRDSWFVAYGEGWALYAETLGPQLGLYTDAYSRYGHLQAQAFRAVRLVVDTGLHALGWTRQQAIDYMVANTGEQPDYVAAEIDRYLADPGQALGYMIGKLKFDELRDRAKVRLGARFDLRRFHMAVLDGGSVPLEVLDHVVDDWIAAGGH